jgi:CHAT domain-containing protein
MAALDLHALPFDGRPLLAGRPVAYSLDLGARPGPVPSPRTALVARDASGELPGAVHEAEQVLAALPGSTALGASDLVGLIGAIERAEHFHYAGHGRAAGPDGLESALVIGDELRLSSADVLTLRRVPDTVVLSGCDLARGAAGRASVSLGVAQAFAARGARAVAAPVRPVRDEDAAAFARLLYAALPRATSFQAAVAEAQLALRAGGSGADWAAFRVIGR